MTKTVRIENADNSKYQVMVEVWDTMPDGTKVLAQEIPLNHPTFMKEVYITSTRFLVVRENGTAEV